MVIEIVDLPFKNMVISLSFLLTFTRPGKGQAQIAAEAPGPPMRPQCPRPWRLRDQGLGKNSDAARVAIDLGFGIWYNIYIYK